MLACYYILHDDVNNVDTMAFDGVIYNNGDCESTHLTTFGVTTFTINSDGSFTLELPNG